MNRFAKFAGFGAASLAFLYKTNELAFTKQNSSHTLELERRAPTELSQLRLFSVTENKELANEIAFYLNTRIGKLQVVRQGDEEEPKVNIFEDVSSKVIYLICSFNPTQDSPQKSIKDLVSAVSAAKTKFASKINVVLPFYGNDTTSEEYISRMLEDAGADKIFTVNMHENQNEASSHIPMIELDANRLCASYFNEKKKLKDLVIVYENEALEGRVEQIKENLEKTGRKVDLGMIKKEIGSKLNYVGENLEGRDVLVVDNVIDSGEPIYNMSKYLKDLGAKNINMFAIHGVLDDQAIDFINYSPIKELVVTNTLPLDMNHLSAKVNQVSVAKMLADTIAQSTFHKNLQELSRESHN